MTTERVGFEDWLGITPCGAAHELAYEAFKAGAAWQRAQGAAVPEGYALVPVEPTPAMRAIGARDCSALIQPDQAGEVWRAMIGAVVVPADYAFSAAAPAHPAERQQGEVQRLREALEHCSEVMKDPWKHGEGCISRAINRADAARAAIAGQEVGK